MAVDVADIVVVPAATAVASPVVASIVATLVFDEDQVTVTVVVVLLDITPEAENCCVVPTVTVGAVDGVTVIDARVGAAAGVELLLLLHPDNSIIPHTKRTDKTTRKAVFTDFFIT
jgi:hypothetical protein